MELLPTEEQLRQALAQSLRRRSVDTLDLSGAQPTLDLSRSMAPLDLTASMAPIDISPHARAGSLDRATAAQVAPLDVSPLAGTLDSATGKAKALAALLKQQDDPSQWPADITLDRTGSGALEQPPLVKADDPWEQPGQDGLKGQTPLADPPLMRASAVPGQLDAATASLGQPGPAAVALLQRRAGADYARPPEGSTDDLGTQRAAGLLALMSGNKALGSAGQSLVDDAQAQTQAKAQADQRALDRAIKEANEKRQEKRDAEYLDEKKREADLKSDDNKYRWAALAQQRKNAQQEREDRRATQADAKQQRDDDLALQKFGQALNPASFRAGNAKLAQGRLMQADNLLKMVEGNPNPDIRQIHELAIGVNKLLSGNGSGSLAETQALVPHSLIGDFNVFKEKLTNDPTGTGQQAFVAKLVDTIRREREQAEGQMRGIQGAAVSAFAPLARRRPDDFKAALIGQGLDPADFDEQTWAYKGKGKTAAPPDATASLRAKYGL